MIRYVRKFMHMVQTFIVNVLFSLMIHLLVGGYYVNHDFGSMLNCYQQSMATCLKYCQKSFDERAYFQTILISDAML